MQGKLFVCFNQPFPHPIHTLSQKPLYQPYFSFPRRHELQKHKRTVAMLLSCWALMLPTNKACSSEDFRLMFSPHPHYEKECKQKETARHQPSTNLERICGCGRGHAREGGRTRMGCCFLLGLFTSPKRNPWNTTVLSLGLQLYEFPHAVNLHPLL